VTPLPTPESVIWITLLVELGVAAAVSSSLTRSKTFRDLLLMRHRTSRQTAKLVAITCFTLVLGVWVRVRVRDFLAADISFETTILLGILLGPLAAMGGGAAMSIFAFLHGEHWSLPVNVLVGLISGTFGRFVDAEDIWSFSPLIDLSIYRWIRRNLKRPHLDRQIMLLLLISGMQLFTSQLSRLRPKEFFQLWSNDWRVEAAICLCAPVVVGIPLKIWNQLRIEEKLEEQTSLLLEAKLDALQRQINPHFLFNTLNSITSLVRSKPELAREMIVKLANILRILLKDREAFVPFSEELAFTDDYLDIEVVRFGEKLRVVKEISPETLAVVVPSMLLQPLLENSIKHGLEPRIDGGTVTLRSRITTEGRLLIEVEDDGVGIAPGRPVAGEAGRGGIVRPTTGIGMKNVRERMQVLYGQSAEVEIESRPGRGTKVKLTMPVIEGAGGGWVEMRDTVAGVLRGLGR
jgi:two-component system LytT family sensor kinase